jgi:hypothetical protein
MGGGHSRNSSQENASSHLRFLQILGPLLDAHPPCHLAHGSEQGEPALFIAQRFVGHAGGSAGQHGLGEFAASREMKIGEDDWPGRSEVVFLKLRLLYLHEQVGPSKISAASTTVPLPASE